MIQKAERPDRGRLVRLLASAAIGLAFWSLVALGCSSCTTIPAIVEAPACFWLTLESIGLCLLTDVIEFVSLFT